ncbi:dehydrogenase/reductase sdr family member 11 [Holotrichia oblita]|uniref:Dehydrogenase/reductase sdr family member 11 n=1 Tax=Holotrichia oblita TaxID=644536 RepID=A0ACB9SIB1_HOLOL|nr:dehydrogenase/reductase sdr family member 11 [Holotrichia oblita]
MVLSLERWVGKVAIVTGASSGCGAAIAERLVAEGRRSSKTHRKSGRTCKKLSNKQGKLYPIKADITKEEDILAAFAWIKENLGTVDILINNAGTSKNTTLSDGDTEMWRQILETNVLGLCVTTREAIKDMRTNSIAGQIIHIGSVLGHYVAHVPKVNMYSASKFAVRALTETLRQELLTSGTKIRVCSISPGPVDTEFIKTEKAAEEFTELFEAMPKLEADDVADAVIYVLSTPPHVQVQDIFLRPLGEPV